MTTLQCPSCRTEMTEKKDPDIRTEICPGCGGVFLDKGELDAMATGLHGNIEFCTIDTDQHKDKFPLRKCPKCSDQEMQKVNLLSYSSIIFDYCPNCEGFFLDKSEVCDMNQELAQLTDSKKSAEYRDYISSHLVRLDKVNDVRFIFKSTGVGVFAQPGIATCLRLTVYLKSPLKLGFRLSSERWTDKFLKAIHFFKQQDIQAGDKDLDSKFIIQGQHAEAIRSLLLTTSLRDALLRFASSKYKMHREAVKLEILDNRIVCTEGPYSTDVNYDVHSDPNKIVSATIDLAEAIEKGHGAL